MANLLTGGEMVPNELRQAVAKLYLSRYKRIILWGTGINPVPVKFDSLYTDMSWVKVNRASEVMEGDLCHYTDMLVRNTVLSIYYIPMSSYSGDLVLDMAM